ncbi:MAG: hypothetical protein Rhob2KO_45250 [Rhodopirellula baltica]
MGSTAEDGRATLRFNARVGDSGSESVCHIAKGLAYAAGYAPEQLRQLGLQTEFL